MIKNLSRFCFVGLTTSGFLLCEGAFIFLRQNTIKAQQLSEAEVDPTSLRGVTYFAPEFYDPEFSEYQGALRDRYPDYYLSPTEEFIYQTTRGKMKEAEGRFYHIVFHENVCVHR